MSGSVAPAPTIRRRYRALRRRRPWRVGVLLIVGLATLGGANLLPPYLGEHPFPFFYAYILFAAWYGDGWDGVTAVTLGALAYADVLPPGRSLAIANPVDAAAETVFTVTSLLLVTLIQRLRRAHALARTEIAERRRIEEALRASEERLRIEHAAAEAARRIAEDALGARDRFLATVSHELQTPLTAVGAGLGLLEMNASERLQPPERALLANARRNTESLRRQIADLLTLGKGVTDTLTLECDTVDLRDVAGDALAGIHALVAEKGQTLDVDLSAPLPVRGDARRLEQTVVNLLSNAHRYTPPGATIRVVGRVAEGAVTLTVGDDGPGIPEDERERIFARFYRLGATGGGGLGLSIARGIVELHGGRLWAEGGPGQGAAFHLRLPQGTAETAETAETTGTAGTAETAGTAT